MGKVLVPEDPAHFSHLGHPNKRGKFLETTILKSAVLLHIFLFFQNGDFLVWEREIESWAKLNEQNMTDTELALSASAATAVGEILLEYGIQLA